MTTKLTLLIVPLLLAGMSLTWLPAQVEGEATSQDFTHAIKASDYVVIGRIIGMVDRNPSPAAPADRKTREAHRVVVQATLKGHDIAQRTIIVRPNTLQWIDGSTYVLFLEDRGNGFFDAIPEVVLTQTPAEIASAARQLGFAVLPRLELRMRHLGGCCSTHSGMLEELRVMADGRFEFEARVKTEDGHLEKKVDVFQGVLPKEALSNLIKSVKTVKKAPLPDGGGLLNFEMSGAPGKVEYHTFTLLGQPEAVEILEAFTRLARANARKSARINEVEER